jgi:hypothetical protein
LDPTVLKTGLLLLSILFLPDIGENTFLPFTYEVAVAVELLASESLGVETSDLIRNAFTIIFLDLRQSSCKHVVDGSLTTTSSTYDHKSVTHSRSLEQLDHLNEEAVVVFEVPLPQLSFDLSLLLGVFLALLCLKLGEDVFN